MQKISQSDFLGQMYVLTILDFICYNEKSSLVLK